MLELGSLLPADFDPEKEKKLLLAEFKQGLHPATVRETVNAPPAPGDPNPIPDLGAVA